MRNKVVLFIAALATLLSYAAAEDFFFFAGHVYDDLHSPISGVTATFRTTITTYTDSTGLYHFENAMAVRKAASSSVARTSFTINGSQLYCVLTQSEPMHVGIFDIRGRQISHLNLGIVQSGAHTIALPLTRKSGNSSMPYIIQVTCGSQSMALRSIAGLSTGKSTLISARQTQSALYDNTIITDTLALSKTGYLARRIGINGYADSIPDITLYRDAVMRPVLVRGRFAPGITGVVTAKIWYDGTSILDTLFSKVPWTTDSNGTYSRIVYMYKHMPSHCRLTVMNKSIVAGSAVATVDTLTDTLVLNCRSSIPVVKAWSDTSVGWGDTVRLHGSVVDSVDTVVGLKWNMNGTSFGVDIVRDTFAVVPMLVDSVFTCQLTATDTVGNTGSAKVYATMTCTARNFRIMNTDISDWAQAADSGYSLFTDSRVSGALDTTAQTFGSSITDVVKQNMKQSVSGGVVRTMSAVIMDCASRSSAQSLYAAYKNRIASGMLVACPSYADSAAVIDNSPANGCIVYARFKRIVIAVRLNGFIDYTTMLANASRFVKVYEQRATKTSICRNE